MYHQVQCEHDDAAVVLYLQAPSASLNDIAMCMVLEQMLAAPFFNALRTEQQLGYVVGTGYVPHNQHPGISFYVQSPTHGPDALLNAMTEFLFQQLHEIEFYQYYWSSIQQNLLKQLEERDLSLSMKSQRLWVSLGTKDLEFNRNTRLAECIAGISFNDIRLYATKLAERALLGKWYYSPVVTSMPWKHPPTAPSPTSPHSKATRPTSISRFATLRISADKNAKSRACPTHHHLRYECKSSSDKAISTNQLYNISPDTDCRPKKSL